MSGRLRGLRLSGENRRRLRALHRDIGYLAVGLTVIYAVSGIAVNHIKDWDPNFTQVRRSWQLEPSSAPPAPLSQDPAAAEAAARIVLSKINRTADSLDVYAVDDTHLDLTLADSTIYVDLTSGEVTEEGQKDRFFLRLANWLHLNRGKKAWTYVADFYAGSLLLLAASGLFMIPGRKGLLGRGGLLVGLGVAIPIAFVLLSGGP